MATIAILDDSATNRHIYSRLAAAVDSVDDVKAFADPVDALPLLADDLPDLIITDYKMPEMDGAAFIKAFRQLPGSRDIPIIVVTVYEERNFRLQALEAGATDFLLSPVDHHEFMVRVHNLLKLRLQQKIIEERTHDLEMQLENAEHIHEAAMRNSSKRLVKVIDTVPAMISATDKDGRYVFVNAFHAEIFGKKPHELVNRQQAECLDPEASRHHASLDERVLAGEEILEAFEQEIIDADGNKRWFLTSKAALRDLSGNSVHVLTSALEITDRKKAEREILQVAYHDAVSGLPNRLQLRNTLTALIADNANPGSSLAVHFVDIDRFKGVNEALGYATGDVFIQTIAERLERIKGPSNVLGHFGGDEFIIVQVDIANDGDVARLAQDVLACISQPVLVGGKEIIPTASIGISVCPSDGDTADELTNNASLAMDRAKSEGGNTIQFFAAGMNRRAKDAIALDHDLRKALSRGEFELHYQPQIAVRTGRVVGVEALLRWRRSGGELVAPDRFLPYAEESGLILPISEWVLHEACSQIVSWQDLSLPPLRLAVNLSPLQFQRQDVGVLVRSELSATGLDPQCLELELTENMVMQNAEAVVNQITSLREHGVQFAIDDFGTGYSSLSYIKKLPISRLKIDRSFVANVASNDSDAAIVRTILALANALQIGVTAEGVETSAQLELLTSLGCDEVQGYLFSRPLPRHDCIELLLAHFGKAGAVRSKLTADAGTVSSVSVSR